MAVRFAAFDGCGYRTASLISHHHNQRHIQMLGCIFNARELGIAGDIAGDAHIE